MLLLYGCSRFCSLPTRGGCRGAAERPAHARQTSRSLAVGIGGLAFDLNLLTPDLVLHGFHAVRAFLPDDHFFHHARRLVDYGLLRGLGNFDGPVAPVNVANVGWVGDSAADHRG